jgi:hypothetical protein
MKDQSPLLVDGKECGFPLTKIDSDTEVGIYEYAHGHYSYFWEEREIQRKLNSVSKTARRDFFRSVQVLRKGVAKSGQRPGPGRPTFATPLHFCRLNSAEMHRSLRCFAARWSSIFLLSLEHHSYSVTAIVLSLKLVVWI